MRGALVTCRGSAGQCGSAANRSAIRARAAAILRSRRQSHGSAAAACRCLGASRQRDRRADRLHAGDGPGRPSRLGRRGADLAGPDARRAFLDVLALDAAVRAGPGYAGEVQTRCRASRRAIGVARTPCRAGVRAGDSVRARAASGGGVAAYATGARVVRWVSRRPPRPRRRSRRPERRRRRSAPGAATTWCSRPVAGLSTSIAALSVSMSKSGGALVHGLALGDVPRGELAARHVHVDLRHDDFDRHVRPLGAPAGGPRPRCRAPAGRPPSPDRDCRGSAPRPRQGAGSARRDSRTPRSRRPSR